MSRFQNESEWPHTEACEAIYALLANQKARDASKERIDATTVRLDRVQLSAPANLSDVLCAPY